MLGLFRPGISADTEQVLDAKQPIYPFVHLELRSSVDAGRVYERTGEAGSVWKLPNREEVLRWKDERAELEAEVLAFDGGDLGRMKHKTRGEDVLITGGVS